MIEDVLAHIYQMPGSMLIRNPEPAGNDGLGHKAVGIGHTKYPKRFLDIFEYRNEYSIGFKHDPQTIENFYREYPQHVRPYDKAPRYWSIVKLEDEVGLSNVISFVDKSYDLILQKYPKSAKLQLKEGGYPNRFWEFFNICEKMSEAEGDEEVFVNFWEYESLNLTSHFYKTGVTFWSNSVYFFLDKAEFEEMEFSYSRIIDHGSSVQVFLGPELSAQWESTIISYLWRRF